MKKRYSIFALLLVVVLLLAACGGGGAEQAAPAEEAPAAAEEAAAPAEGAPLRIGYSVATLENAFFVGMTKGVVDEAEAKGADLLQANANGDAATQVNQILDLMTQGVDVLILNPINADGIVPVVERANEEGIPVITLDRGSNGGEVASFLETDNVAMGQEAAQYIVDKLTERYGEPKGNVVNLQGLRGTTAAESREEGFMGEISKYPGIKVVVSQAADFNQEKALNIMSNAIQANPQIDAVFGANDDNAMGAVKAIEQAGLAKTYGDPEYIYVIGIDGTAQAIEAIRNGALAATISQNPVTMAAQAVDIAYQIRDGETPEAHILWPHQLITGENINSPEVQQYGIWSEE
jgi:ribose transport system substrate-binding protein